MQALVMMTMHSQLLTPPKVTSAYVRTVIRVRPAQQSCRYVAAPGSSRLSPCRHWTYGSRRLRQECVLVSLLLHLDVLVLVG